MQDSTREQEDKVVLVTGGAKRIGAAVARRLHAQGMRIALHYRSSADSAHALARELNGHREQSVELFQGDLVESGAGSVLVNAVVQRFGRLDAVVNNASSFFATPLDTVSETVWDDLMGTNLKAPFFIAQTAAEELTRRGGAIVNIADIYAERPLEGYCVYSMAKAALVMLTKALAVELGPAVRVNAIAPGAILWPEAADDGDDEARERIVAKTPLRREGKPEEIARTVSFLLDDASFVTGQTIRVDGGRSLRI